MSNERDMERGMSTGGRNYKLRRSYCDHFKAAALEAVQANCGRVRETATELGIPHNTLLRWLHDGVPMADELRDAARVELADRYEDEAHAALDEAPNKRPLANYQQLIMGAAIATDKMRLLREQPTGIHAQQLTDEERLARVSELLATALALPDPEQPTLPEGEETSDHVG